MKKMKKLITLLLSLTMIFALCACGQTAEPKTEEPAKTDAPAADVAAADEPVTLRLYTRYSDEDNIKRIDYAVEKLKDDSCTFAIMNFINAVSDYEAEHGAALEGLKITTEKVIFTGFPTASDHEHLTAFAQLAVLMNQQAISQKRIQAKDVNDENEKYALRTWLLRLGMNGPDFKETRKILMENLSGHAAFRTDEEAQKFLAREKAKRDALKAAKLAAQNGDPATGETVAPDTTRPTQPDCGADTAQMLEAGA